MDLAALIQWNALLELAGEVVRAVFVAVTLGSTVVAMTISAVLESTAFGVEAAVDPHLLALFIETPGAIVALVVLEATVIAALTAVSDTAFTTGAVPVLVALDAELTDAV